VAVSSIVLALVVVLLLILISSTRRSKVSVLFDRPICNNQGYFPMSFTTVQHIKFAYYWLSVTMINCPPSTLPVSPSSPTLPFAGHCVISYSNRSVTYEQATPYLSPRHCHWYHWQSPLNPSCKHHTSASVAHIDWVIVHDDDIIIVTNVTECYEELLCNQIGTSFTAA